MKPTALRLLLPCLLALSPASAATSAASAPAAPAALAATAASPDTAPALIADRQAMQAPANVALTGWVGQRILGSETNRLVKVDVDRMLEGYRKRPGRQSWEGEHIGKWLHAATLAWAHSGDPALRAKIDSAVVELLKTQLEDGYLGTYIPARYWSGFDVWSHKYNLIGLLTYMRHTGNVQPLEACRRIGDLLYNTFGDENGKRDITKSGWHAGMASSSVLEPMALLHRLTGEKRYLDFCEYIVRSWEQPDGPKIISTLLATGRVDQVGNAKAYEMLSCLLGVLELYRTNHDPRLLTATLNAWKDIHENRLYLTGAASSRELFRDDHELPNTNNVGETCVTVTWLQFNAQLLRLTGEARFAEELERVVLNQLLGAQNPSCDAWGYYVEMEGRKPYSSALTGNCCLSSGPRGVALIPTFATSTDADGAVVNLYEAGTAKLALRDGTAVTLATDTRYPADGRIRISVTPSAPATFALKLRIPEWSAGAPLRINGTATKVSPGADGYVALRRAWKAGDTVELDLTMQPRVLIGEHTNVGKAAFLYGPLVLAADDAFLPSGATSLRPLVLPSADLQKTGFTVEPATGKFLTWPGAQVFRIEAGARETTGATTSVVPQTIRLVPFADAGGFGSHYKIWLTLASALAPNISIEGLGAASGRSGAAPAAALAINDGDLNSTTTASSGATAGEQWFSVSFARPLDLRRVAFVHGFNLTQRGWFDTSAGKPVVYVQRRIGGAWEKIGELADYPATTATEGAIFKRELKGQLDVTTGDIERVSQSQTFSLALSKPETAVAVRVAGMPSSGEKTDNHAVSCAELQVFVR